MNDFQLALNSWNKTWISKGLNITPDPHSNMININGVRGYLVPGDVAFLWNLAASLPKGGTYLEIGSWMGLSSIVVSTSLIASLNFDARVFCVDTWEGSEEHQSIEEVLGKQLHNIFLNNITQAGVDHFIVPRRGPSLEIVNTIPNNSLDIVFIDGDHSQKGCYADMVAWMPKVKHGGRFLGHDAMEHQGMVRDAVTQFCEERKLKYSITPPPYSNYIWEVMLHSSESATH